jgi:hypothetical protein
MSAIASRPRELMISTRREQHHVCIDVCDAGVGLDEQAMGRLFETFYTTKPQGIGIGLSISRAIVAEHGGRVWATRNKHHGATFHVALPAASKTSLHAGSATNYLRRR